MHMYSYRKHRCLSISKPEMPGKQYRALLVWRWIWRIRQLQGQKSCKCQRTWWIWMVVLDLGILHLNSVLVKLQTSEICFFFFAFFKGAELQSKGANMEIYLKVFPSFGCGFDSYFMRFGSLISFKSIKITMLKLSWRYVAVVRVKSGVSSTCWNA